MTTKAYLILRLWTPAAKMLENLGCSVSIIKYRRICEKLKLYFFLSQNRPVRNGERRIRGKWPWKFSDWPIAPCATKITNQEKTLKKRLVGSTRRQKWHLASWHVAMSISAHCHSNALHPAWLKSSSRPGCEQSAGHPSMARQSSQGSPDCKRAQTWESLCSLGRRGRCIIKEQNDLCTGASLPVPDLLQVLYPATLKNCNYPLGRIRGWLEENHE